MNDRDSALAAIADMHQMMNELVGSGIESETPSADAMVLAKICPARGKQTKEPKPKLGLSRHTAIPALHTDSHRKAKRMTDHDTSSTPNHTEPVYAMLLTNEATTVLPVDPTQPILAQVSGAVPDAVGSMLLPGWRDVEVHSCRRWEWAEMVLLSLEWALSVDNLKINYPAWWFYGRSPIVGPAVIMHDSTEDGQPVEIPPEIATETQAGITGEDEVVMDLALDTSQFADWAHLR